MVTKLFIYKTNKRKSSAHTNTVLRLLQHVSAELRYLQGVYTPVYTPVYNPVYTPIFQTH